MIMQVCPYHDSVAINGYGQSEQVAGRAVADGELGLLGPGCPAPLKDIGRAGVGARLVVPERPNDNRVAVNRHGPTELISSLGISGGELGLADPSRADPLVDIRRAGVAKDVGGGGIIVLMRPHHGRVAVDADVNSEPVTRRRVGGDEFGFLGPRGPAPLEDIPRAGVDAQIIVLMCTNHDGVATNGDAPELVIDLTRLRYVASPQIGALVAACRRAAEAGRVLRVLIRPALERFLGRMKVDGLIDYELVEESD